MSSAESRRPRGARRPPVEHGQRSGARVGREQRTPIHPLARRGHSMDAGEMPARTEDQRDAWREADPLAALVALAEARRLDAAAFRHEGFLEWLGRACRWPDGGGQWTEGQIERMLAELMARLEIATLAVPRIIGAPELRRPPVAGVVGRVLARAAAEGCAPWLDSAIAAGSGRDLWDEACESWVALPAGVKRGGGQFVALTVAGDSMTPLLHSGDVILVRLGAEASRGSVVVARRPDDGFVVKQVGDIDATSIELRSLNPAFPPITVPRTARPVAGTVVLSWCTHGHGGRGGA